MKLNVLRDRCVFLARQGTEISVMELISFLTDTASFQELKVIDFTLGLVTSDEGIKVLEKVLFRGSRIQRNYCANYFRRKGEPGSLEHELVLEAWEQGAIDDVQAFAR